MAAYRSRPVEIEAEQWFPDPEITGTGYDRLGVEYTVCDRAIRTLHGNVRVAPGDWIVKGVMGSRFPVKDSVFRLTYDPVEAVKVEHVPGYTA